MSADYVDALRFRDDRRKVKRIGPSMPGTARTDRPFPHFDTLFVCLAMLNGLFPMLLGSATALGFILLPALFCYYRADRLAPMIGRVWPLLFLPLYAILSAVWSLFPETTVYYGIQLFLTILLATMIGAGTDPDETLLGLFLAFGFYSLLAFFNGLSTQSLILFGGGEQPLVTIANSKNATADMACLGLLTAMGMLGSAIARGRILLALLALTLAMMNVIVAISAQSAGAIAAVAAGAAVLIGMSMIHRLPLVGRTVVAIVAAIFAIVASVTRSIWLDPMFERFLTVSGKDDQLTGRGYVWERADVLISQHPLLGRGFASFWRPGDLEAEAIWEKMYIFNRSGFNFHNSVYEILVYFGYVGLVIFSLVFILFSILLLIRAINDPRAITIVFCGALAYFAMRAAFESLPVTIFSHATLFLYAALAHGTGLELGKNHIRRTVRIIRPRPGLPARQAEPLVSDH